MEQITCAACNGTGFIEEELDDDGDCMSKEECQVCGGTGYELLPE